VAQQAYREQPLSDTAEILARRGASFPHKKRLLKKRAVFKILFQNAFVLPRQTRDTRDKRERERDALKMSRFNLKTQSFYQGRLGTNSCCINGCCFLVFVLAGNSLTKAHRYRRKPVATVLDIHIAVSQPVATVLELFLSTYPAVCLSCLPVGRSRDVTCP
jgi:hypothetical protein